MKVGILTFHRAINYGASLQAWALQSYLIELGCECSIIDYRCALIEETYKPFSLVKFVKSSLPSKISYLLNHIVHFKNIGRRNDKFKEFWNSDLQLTPMEKLYELDAVICGSDQIWNPYLTGGLDSVYTLADNRFDNKIKIAYAVSGETTNLVKGNVVNDIRNKINDFSALSFREPDLVSLFQPYYNGKIECCVDPTFLLEKSQWESFSGFDPLIKERYIFVYQVVSSEKCFSIAKRLAKEKGAKIVYLNSAFKIGQKEKNIPGVVGPREFVNLIRNAEYVVTTSFHGTALSIILQRQFIFVPTGRNNRQLHLLRSLNLDSRIASDNFALFDIVDYNKVPLSKYISLSRNFLKDNLLRF